jgi:hypothetical protein
MEMKPSNDREAITLIIDGLIKVGVKPKISRDGENEDLPFTDTASAVDWLTSCDESVLFVNLPPLNSDEEAELQRLEIEFAAAGGRGVETADRLDSLRRRYNGENTFLYFVLGNDPEEVVCDYGVSLSPYLDPIVNPWWE